MNRIMESGKDEVNEVTRLFLAALDASLTTAMEAMIHTKIKEIGFV